MMTTPVTFLIVEDDEIDLKSLKRAFRDLKIANLIVEARDGLQALELLRNGAVPRPYLILLDINMPRMNGFEFLDEIRQDELLSDSVVFVLTTSKSEEDVMHAYRNHVAGYVVKKDAARGLQQAVTLLDKYWRVVELPM